MSKFTQAMAAAKERSASVADFVENEKIDPPPNMVAPAPARIGRPAGKRSSESTIQVTAYIEASTHVETKIKLLQNSKRSGKKQDFSALVQELLDEWLNVQK